jgi:hypothetical protein
MIFIMRIKAFKPKVKDVSQGLGNHVTAVELRCTD